MAALGSDIPIASFYFRSTAGFPRCCSKDAHPRFGNLDSIPIPGPVQDLDITDELLSVMKEITDVHRRQMRRTLSFFLLVICVLLGCVTTVGAMALSSSSSTDHSDIDNVVYSGVAGFLLSTFGVIMSVCCCICTECKASRDLKSVLSDFNMRCKFNAIHSHRVHTAS